MGAELLRILYVENHKHIYQRVKEVLTLSNCPRALSWVPHAEAALARLGSESFDVIVLSLGSTNLNDLDLFKSIKDRGIDIPSIIMIEPSCEHFVVEAIDLGAHEYLTRDKAGAYLKLLPALVTKAYDLSKERKARQKIETTFVQQDSELSRLRKQHELAETLSRVGLALNSTLDLPELLNLICLESMSLFDVDAAYVWLAQGEQLVGFAGQGTGVEQFIGQRISTADPQRLGAKVFRERRPIFVNDAPYSDQINKQFVELFRIKAILGVPLIKGDSSIGALIVLDTQNARRFNSGYVKTATILSSYAAVAIENARLLDEARHRARHLETLRQVSEDLAVLRDLDTLLRQIVERAIRLFDADGGGIYLYRPERRVLEWAVAVGDNLPATGLTLNHGEGLSGRVWASGKPLIINDYQNWFGKSPKWDDRAVSVVGAPIQQGNEFLGVLCVRTNYFRHQFVQEEANLLSQFAMQAAIAIQNVRLFAETRQWAEQLEVLYRTSLGLTSSFELQPVLDTILESTLKLANAPRNAHIFLYQNDRLKFGAARWADGRKGQPFAEPRPQGITYTVARQGQLITVPDMRNHPLFVGTPADWAGAIVALPLKIGQRVVGVMNISSSQTRSWPEAELQVLRLLADQAALAIENARLYQAERASRQEAEALHRTTVALVSSIDLDEVIDHILTELQTVVPYDSASVQLLKEDRTVIIGGRGFTNLSELLNYAFKIRGDNAYPLNSTVIEQKKPFIVANTQTYPDPFTEKPHDTANIRSWLGVPMLIGEQVIGMITLDKQQPDFYTEAHAHLATAYAAQAAIAIDNARLHQTTIEQLAQLKRLYELTTEFVSILSPTDVAALVIEKVVQATNAHSAVLNVLDEQGNLELAAGPGDEAPPRPKGTTMSIFKSGQPLIVNNAQHVPHLIPDSLRQKGIQASIGLPLKAGENTIGVLFVRHDRPHHFYEQEIEILFIFANQAAIAIQNARLYEQAQQEIIERRRTEEKLAEERNLLRTLIDNVPDYIYVKDTDSRFILSNIWHARSMGAATPDEIVGKTDFDFYPSDIAAMFFADDQTVIGAGQALVNKEEPALDPDGHVRWVLTTKVPLHDSRGRLVGLVGISRDISERKQAEAELNEYREHLEDLVNRRTAELADAVAEAAAARDKIDAILQSVADGLIVTDLNYKVILANPAAETLLDFRLEAAMSQEIDKAIKSSWLREVVHTALKYRINDCEVEVKLEDPQGGQLKIINARTALVDDRQGKPLGTVTIIRDVTRLREVDRLKTEFLSIAAHELRTPLTSIQGFSEILLVRDLDFGRKQRYLSLINEQARQLAEIINNILDISRLEAGRGLELNLESIDVPKLIEEVTEPFIESSPKHTIQIEGLTEWPLIMGDMLRLGQIYKNLLSNAVKYSPNGGQILIRSRLLSNCIEFSVQDEGIGMTAEQQIHLFEKFYRADTSNTAIGGTGLGLAISKLIVDLHGGDIWVDSQRGVGTTVSFTLPLA